MADDPTDVLGRRIGAALLDIVVLVVLLIVVGVIFGDSQSSGSSASVNLRGGSAVVYFVLVFAYFCVGEGLRGQTLGKLLLSIEVVGEDQRPPGLGRAAVRTLLRVLDALPLFYLVGLVTVLATGTRRQRIGDLAAHTHVVARR